MEATVGKIVIALALIVVAVIVLNGFLHVFGVGFHAGDGYAGVSWNRNGCSDCGGLTREQQEFIRDVYK